MIRIATILSVAFSLRAQVELGGLRTGYVADETSRVVRPVIGTPGSAYLGPALLLDFAVSSVSTAPNALIAISHGESPAAWLIRSPEGSPSQVRLASASQAFASPRAPTAVLFSREDAELRMVTALDGDAASGPPVPEASLGAKFRSASIDDDTGCAILASSAAGEMRLHLLCPSHVSEPRPLSRIPDVEPAAIAYSKRLDGLLVADAAGGRVILVRSPLEAGNYDTLVQDLDQLAGIQPISATQALAVQREPARAVVIDVRARRIAQTIDLPATPSLLQYLVPDRVLALNRPSEDPLLVIDLSQDNAAFLVASAGAGK